jgi:hypothetical protein
VTIAVPPPQLPSCTGPEAAVDIVQRTIIGFGNNRHDPEEIVSLVGRGIAIHHPACGGVMSHANTVRIGDDDGAKEITAIRDPVRARHFTIAIEAMNTGIDRNRRLRLHMRHNCGHATARRTLAARTRLVLDDRLEADPDTIDIGDRIIGASAPGKRNTEVTATRFTDRCL